VRGTSIRAVSTRPGPKTIREAPIIAGSSGGIGRRLVFISLTFALLGLLGLVVEGSAQAEPAAITQAKQEAQALRELIDDLENQVDAAIEEYNYAAAMLAQTTADAEATQALLEQAEAGLQRVSAQLSGRLVQIYKYGQLGVLDALLACGSFSELVNRMDWVERLSAEDAELLAKVRTYRDQKIARAAELAQQIEEQKVYKAETEAARVKVEERLVANEKALAGKQAQIRQLEKEEAARQAALAAAAKKAAEEAARKARAAAQAKARAAAAAAAAAQSAPLSVPASASASDVVSVALKYLGCKYVWAGSSPDGFDCSGFVMYVYLQVGVSLPHSSRMQYGYGVPVDRASLRPGDLLFFYNPIHHAAIYVGDGKMVHAAGMGKGVRVDEIWNSYNCACRIIR
jgi:cell wall-associated NlpC family hydrolase